MKIDNQQIIDTARQQRDLDTSAMHVKPWEERHQHFQIPTWLVALPAAAIAGFLFGLFFNKSFSDDAEQLMATADTIYVTREVMIPQTPDTIIRYVERPKIKKDVRDVKTVNPSVVNTKNSMAFTGRSIDQDNIDYTMLVMK